MIRKRLKQAAGFTLIEVAVALSVLSVGLLSMAAVIPLAKRDMLRSDQRTKAVFLAQETAEWLHGLPYNDPLLVAGTHADPNFAVAGYVRSWNVADGNPIANVKRVTVTVSRTNAGSTALQNRQNAVVVFLHAEAGH